MKNDLLDPKNSPSSIEEISNVRRLNRLPLMIAFSIGGIVFLGLMYALFSRQSSRRDPAPIPITAEVGNNNVGNSLTFGVGDGIIEAKKEEPMVEIETVDENGNMVIKSVPMSEAVATQQSLPTSRAERRKLANTQANKEDEDSLKTKKLIRDFRERNFYDAVVARTAADGSTRASAGRGGMANAVNAATGALSSGNPQLDALKQAIARQSAAGGGGAGFAGGQESLLEEKDPNLRLRKDAFASRSDNPYHYSKAQRQAQLTPYEIRVGSIIPAVMISGINSDLPGDIIAQVSQDVRDTRTGRYVLIPQGSKLIGRYDSHIAMGQERVMIAWYRVQFPDASTFDLDNMGAVDLAGYAGVKDKVNNHTWRIFKNAFLLSIIGAGASIAIGEGDNEDDNDPVNTLRAEMGRQFGQVGSNMISRNLNIQPTLEIRPGYRFNVMVNKDLILQPYQ